jgi:hypothetical protein
MLSLLKNELTCLESLLKLAKEQKRVLVSQDLVKLNSILKEKDDWIKKIAHIEEKLIPLKKEWSKKKDKGSRASEEVIENLVDRGKILLKELLLIEEESRNLILEKQTNIKAHIRDLQKRKRILRSYATKRSYIPRFIDIKR